jgi:eukaryotic-like serine/threonine-protein kinase
MSPLPRTPSFMDEPTVPIGPEGEETLAQGQTLARAPEPRPGASVSEPESARTPMPASRLGRFTVLEKLGAGGMGVVFAAYDPKLDRRVALKVLRREVASDPDGEAEARLLREAQAMARVSHPNVIPVFDVGAFGGQIYVAMEYVAGVTLRQWMTLPHEPAEVLAVFEQAGRGLAAAHAAGLVHRDFKPANAMVGDDGRVRVLDFGLARPMTTLAHEVTEDEGRGEVVLDAQITRTGVAMGTPAYMAPEQIEPEPLLDAKSDQFAFCVALYEALFGQSPFIGATLAVRLEQIQAGAVREPPPDRKAPRAVREALLRGLSAQSSARFESMDALLDALRPRASRRRTYALGGAAAAIASGSLAWALLVSGHEGEAAVPCLDAAAPMAALWTPARQSELEASFGATGAAFAPAAWGGAASRVDAYVARGSALRVAACEATRVHGTQSLELLDLRMACLDRGRRELGALLDVWARADGEAVATATRAVTELPPLEPCEDLEALLQGVAPPRDADVAQRVEAGRERLAALRAEERAGHYHDALPGAQAALLELAAVPYPPLHAEAVLVAGRLWLRRGKYEPAREHLERAYELGLAERHDEVALEAAGTLVLLFGEHLSRHDEALAWVRHAGALLQRSGGSAAARRNLLRLRGLLHAQRGEVDRALALQQQSLRDAEQELGPDDYETAMAHHNLGNTLAVMGRTDDARAHYERAQALFETIEGPEHPDVAQALHGLADLAVDAGELDQAQALYQRAYEIRMRALGADHLLVAFSLSRLAVVATRQRRYDEALAQGLRSVEIAEAQLGPDNLQVGRLLNNLGMVYVKTGQLAAAERVAEQVLAIFERQLPATHPHLLMARNNMATLRHERGDDEGALAVMRRVLATQEQSLDPDDPAIADTLDKLGVVLVELERADEAVALHERALVIREARQGAEHLGTAETLAYLAEALVERGDAERAVATCERLLAMDGRFEAPEVLANGRFLLAQARWAVGERGEARAEAARARAAYEAIGLVELVAMVDEWLAAR